MFNEDLQQGKKVEEEFADILISEGKSVVLTHGLNKDFDVGVYDGNTLIDTYEVKNDLMYNKTGNVAIEYECNGVKSGISTTKAKWWVIKLGSRFYIIETEQLKNYLKIIWADATKQQGGDNAKFILIKSNYLLNITDKIYE